MSAQKRLLILHFLCGKYARDVKMLILQCRQDRMIKLSSQDVEQIFIVLGVLEMNDTKLYIAGDFYELFKVEVSFNRVDQLQAEPLAELEEMGVEFVDLDPDELQGPPSSVELISIGEFPNMGDIPVDNYLNPVVFA